MVSIPTQPWSWLQIPPLLLGSGSHLSVLVLTGSKLMQPHTRLGCKTAFVSPRMLVMCEPLRWSRECREQVLDEAQVKCQRAKARLAPCGIISMLGTARTARPVRLTDGERLPTCV